MGGLRTWVLAGCIASGLSCAGDARTELPAQGAAAAGTTAAMAISGSGAAAGVTGSSTTQGTAGAATAGRAGSADAGRGSGSGGLGAVAAGVGALAGTGAASSAEAGTRGSAGGSGSVATAGTGAGGAGAAGTAGMSGNAGMSGGSNAGVGAGSNAGAGSVAGSGGTSGSAGAPLHRISVRVHMARSQLTNDELGPIFEEANAIWQKQAGVCFEFEVTNDETNSTNGIDLRYTSGQIPAAPSANGLAQGQHDVWSIDHPNLGAAPKPVQHPTARTTAHELGHILNLAHENPSPSTDCASPCYCETLNLDCNDFLMRSGRKGFFLSPPEIEIARKRAAQRWPADATATACAAPMFKR